MLACLSVDAVERVLKDHAWRCYTPNMITDSAGFAGELRQILVQGYAFDQEEFNTDVRCVAAPLGDYTGVVVAAMSISGPLSRMTEVKSAEFVQMLTEQTLQMSHVLGYKG